MSETTHGPMTEQAARNQAARIVAEAPSNWEVIPAKQPNGLDRWIVQLIRPDGYYLELETWGECFNARRTLAFFQEKESTA